MDMVFIDADHWTGFRRDYEIEQRFPHRFIAFHDVENKRYDALRKFWATEVAGQKVVYSNTDSECLFGFSEVDFPLPWALDQAQLEERYGRRCGIGIAWT